jgi:dephospho-CoA kinase
MLRVGLTGGIACGKSTVAAMFVQRGAVLLQADSLAHQLYAPGAAVYEEVIRHFGREILHDDQTINRAALADLVFPHRIAELNAIVHPAVVQAQKQWMDAMESAHPDGIALVEAALIVEAGAAQDFDKLIVVTCSPQCKVEHYAQRAGLSLAAAQAEVARRSAAQFSDEEKARHADYVIENSGSLPAAEQHVERIWQELQATAKR